MRIKNNKCPPGVFCVGNITFMLFFVITLGILYLVYISLMKGASFSPPTPTPPPTSSPETPSASLSSYFVRPDPSHITTYHEKDILYNPYTPPLKENPYYAMLVSSSSASAALPPPIFHQPHNTQKIHGGRISMPINIPTSHYDLSYKQTGILTKSNGGGESTILPLFGRPLHSNRNKWQYYTMSDKNTVVKLPISKGGRSCTDHVVGCDELYNGDNVYVEGYGDVFNVTVYENDQPRYIPYL